MKHDYHIFSAGKFKQNSRYLLFTFFLIALNSFSGSNSVAIAQTTAEVCRETNSIIKQYELEKSEVKSKLYYKNNEDYMRDYLSLLNNAIGNRTFLTQNKLFEIAYYIKFPLPKNVEEMTMAERDLFQKNARNFLNGKIQDISQMDLTEIESQLNRVEYQLQIRTRRYFELNCGEVLEREKNRATIPNMIRECESYQGTVCGTWTLRGNQFHAEWTNGAKAVLTVEKFDNDQIIITRSDTESSASRGFTARYTGKLSGNQIVEGIVSWTHNGRTWSGTWTANW